MRSNQVRSVSEVRGLDAIYAAPGVRRNPHPKMELREYWNILRRRWWLPFVLAGLIAFFTLAQMSQRSAPSISYTGNIRMLVGVMPNSVNADQQRYYDPRYFAWLVSEYLVDDFTEVVRSSAFTQNVSKRLADQGIELTPGAIEGGSTTEKRHRIITFTANWGERAQLEAILHAVADEVRQNANSYFQQLGTEGALVSVLDEPTIQEVRTAVVRNRLELPLRAFLGFILGIGLIFLLDYIDTSVRDRRDLEELGLTILGEIPKHKT